MFSNQNGRILAASCRGTFTLTFSVHGGFLEMDLLHNMQFVVGPHTTCFSVGGID